MIHMTTLKKLLTFHLFYIISFFLFLLLPIVTPSTVAAKETDFLPERVSNVSTSVIRIVTTCVDESGNSYYVHSGSGFIIGVNESEQFILSDYRLVTPSEEDYLQIRRGVGLSNETKLTTKIYMYFPSDITIETTVTTASEQIGYALLKPTTPIKNLTYLHLGSTAEITRKQELFMLGYSGELSLLGKDSVPDSTLEMLPCSVTAIERDPITLEIDAYSSTGKAGSPLVNANGDVIGMMSYRENDSLSVIPVETLNTLLDTLGIQYYNTSPSHDYNVADKEIINTFHQLLADYQQDIMENGNRYSKSTLKKYKAAIQQAIEISQKTDATKDEYQEGINAMNKAKKNLKPYNFTYYIIELILLFAILSFLYLNIRQTLKWKKMKTSIEPENIRSKAKKRKQLAALIRLDTNEVIWLTKKGLRIGKNPKEVDYCIYNNPAVSRYHAAIIYHDEKFYILDNYSTNKTCINNSCIESEKPYELFDEDSISIANIVFTFRYLINT